MRARLRTVSAELDGLDDEIHSLSRELEAPSDPDDCSAPRDDSSLEIEELMSEGSRSSSASPTHRLFAQSVSLHQHRTRQSFCSSPAGPEIPVFVRKVATPPNYQAPSERINETRLKRERFRAEFQAQQSATQDEACTFTPEKFSSYKLTQSHPRYEHHRQSCEVVASPLRWIDRNSERIARGARLREKEGTPRRIEPEADPRRKVYSKRRIQKSVERLSRVNRRESDSSDSEEEHHYADPQAIDRLVNDSIQKGKAPPVDPAALSPYRPEIDDHSRQIAAESAHPTGDLFEHSVRLAQEKRDWRQKVKRHREAMEMADCTFQPQINRTLPAPAPVRVHGSLGHVSRLADARRRTGESEPAPQTPPRSRLWSPVVCKAPTADGQCVGAILAEVDATLSRLDSHGA
jgi:hypothetical protein